LPPSGATAARIRYLQPMNATVLLDAAVIPGLH